MSILVKGATILPSVIFRQVMKLKLGPRKKHFTDVGRRFTMFKLRQTIVRNSHKALVILMNPILLASPAILQITRSRRQGRRQRFYD